MDSANVHEARIKQHTIKCIHTIVSICTHACTDNIRVFESYIHTVYTIFKLTMHAYCERAIVCDLVLHGTTEMLFCIHNTRCIFKYKSPVHFRLLVRNSIPYE